MRAAIMRLRNDPTASATMAGAFTADQCRAIGGAIGRQPSEGELYIAHFLGSDGAAKLINAAASQPRANAAELFPQAAAANPSIFLNRSGQPRSAGEVYATLTGRFEVARSIMFAPALRGSATAPTAPPDTAGVTQAFAQANDVPPAVPVPVPAAVPAAGPFFQTMFTDRGSRAVTQTVSNLWTPARSDTPATAAPSLMLNLFTDAPAAPRKAPGGKV